MEIIQDNLKFILVKAKLLPDFQKAILVFSQNINLIPPVIILGTLQKDGLPGLDYVLHNGVHQQPAA